MSSITTTSAVPAANFFWHRLARWLERVRGDLALDMACGPFVNRHLFHTQAYCGLDISLRQLQDGVARFPDDAQSIGVVADIGRPLPFDASADVCVSSYTLSYVPPAQRLQVARHLVAAVRRGGHLVVQFPRFHGYEALVTMLQEHFRRVQVTHYHSLFSQYYTRRLLRRWWQARRGAIAVADSPLLPGHRLTPLWTWLCEGMFPNVPWGNEDVCVFSEEKISGDIQAWSLYHLLPLTARLYRAPRTPRIIHRVLTDDAAEAAYIAAALTTWLQQGIAPEDIGVFTLAPPLLAAVTAALAPAFPVQSLHSPGSVRQPGSLVLACWPPPPTMTYAAVLLVGCERAAFAKRPPMPYLPFELCQVAQQHLVLTAVTHRQGVPQELSALMTDADTTTPS